MHKWWQIRVKHHSTHVSSVLWVYCSAVHNSQDRESIHWWTYGYRKCDSHTGILLSLEEEEIPSVLTVGEPWGDIVLSESLSPWKTSTTWPHFCVESTKMKYPQHRVQSYQDQEVRGRGERLMDRLRVEVLRQRRSRDPLLSKASTAAQDWMLKEPRSPCTGVTLKGNNYAN